MRIAVYCSSSVKVAPENLKLGFDLGVAIASAGHELVWGGGKISVMGTVAQGARSVGGKTIGVIPDRLMNIEFIDNESHEILVVEDMRERKGKIEELSDAFLVLPGGIGTLEEFFEIWVGRYLGFHEKPIAVIDPFGSYG
ncbi:MAG: TIGR00730 family Rossman fold protein, partial [Actinobacteria bacterium]|nr:TIGR00730 family Rossman fold protein [Actinomycetota bacterium]